MVTNLGKTWNGSKFDFGKATGFYSGLDDMAKTITTNSKVVKSATDIMMISIIISRIRKSMYPMI